MMRFSIFRVYTPVPSSLPGKSQRAFTAIFIAQMYKSNNLHVSKAVYSRPILEADQNHVD